MRSGFTIVAYIHKVWHLLFDQAVFLIADMLLLYVTYVMLVCVYRTVGMAAVACDCLFCDERNSLVKVMIFYQHMNAEYNDKNFLITGCSFS